VPGDTKDGIAGTVVLAGAFTVIYVFAEEVPSEFMILMLHWVAASNVQFTTICTLVSVEGDKSVRAPVAKFVISTTAPVR
jgi:hypothetical protein